MNTVSKPLVSVRLMVYNNEPFIRKAVESILMQKTDFKVEIVVGDDFSTDNTLDIIRSYNNTEKIKFKILDRPVGGEYWHKRKDKNASVRTNFIDIVNNCSSKYIALLDGDDYWTDPLKLQKQVDFLEANLEYVICFHPCQFLKINKGVVDLKKQPLDVINYEYSINNLLKYWAIPTTSMLFRNDEKIIFPKWFETIASGDIALVMLLFKKGKFKLIKDYMSVYRVSGTGVSTSHVNYRMIHYRAKLYFYLNEYFNYKYEKEIYDALNFIYLKYSSINPTIQKKSLFEMFVKKIKFLLK